VSQVHIVKKDIPNRAVANAEVKEYRDAKAKGNQSSD
jgi:hypothetical protein